MAINAGAQGPYIIWLDGGCEGWHPTSCDTLTEAVFNVERYSQRFVITKVVRPVVLDEERR